MGEASGKRLSGGDWDAYDRTQMAEQDQRGAIALADRVGQEEGRREGRELGREEGQSLGRSEGEAIGLARAILAFLDARGIRLTSVDRERILRMNDRGTLDRWLQRAVSVVLVEELWG